MSAITAVTRDPIGRATRRAAEPGGLDHLLSLAERSRHLTVVRALMTVVVVVVVAVRPEVLTSDRRLVVIATAAYVALVALTALVAARWPMRRVTLPVLQGALLIDGVYLVTSVMLTGGTQSALRWLIAAQLVAATLLCSHRTGLKLALWNTLLIVLALEVAEQGIFAIDVRAGDPAWVPVAGLWVITLTTAACAVASERTLRAQRADLGSLAAMAARIEERPTRGDIPVLLLDELSATFGFHRGVVLTGVGPELAVAASTVGLDAALSVVRRDPLVAAVDDDREPRLVRRLDASTDPSLARLLPDARNVVILPLAAAGSPCLGCVVLERGGTIAGIPRSTIAMIERFVAHAALALVNAVLTEERDAQLARIHHLEQELRAHNAELESRVEARTHELSETVEVLRETDRQRRYLLDHVVRVAEEERRKIANDVHDDPVQKLVALRMRLELLVKAHGGDPDLERAHDAVKGVLHSMRHLLFDLRPPVLDEAGFDDAIRYLLEQAELPFAWSVDGHLDPEPAEQERVILYRIAQEAVANARKHSEAQNLRVRLGSRNGGSWMEIADDGVGFLPQDAVVAAPGHLGLAAMRERAEMAGGTCALRSLPGGGTTLEVWLPSSTAAARGDGLMPDAAATLRLFHARAS